MFQLKHGFLEWISRETFLVDVDGRRVAWVKRECGADQLGCQPLNGGGEGVVWEIGVPRDISLFEIL